MVKAAAKRNTVVAVPPPPPPKKADPGLQSLMDYGDNLEEFVAICAHLPAELKQDLKNVAALNESTHTLTHELSREQTEVLERAKAKYRTMTRPEQLEGLVDEEALRKTQEKRRKVDHCVSEKVAITKRMYDALDTCIKNIDEEIDRLEKDVKENYGVIPDFALLAPEIAAEAKRNELAAAAAAGGVASGAQILPGVAGNPAMGVAAGGLGAAGGGLAVGADGVARRDDVISANEPVYCVCRQVGWGDMIGCDNEDCEHGEWFHYHCVGLEQVDQKQLSFWLCPGCSADQREKERREQLELIRQANLNSAAVKVAAVKLPEDAEGEEEEGDDDEEDAGGGTGTEGDKGREPEKPGGDRKPGVPSENTATAVEKGAPMASGSGHERAASGAGQAAASEAERKEESPKLQVEQGDGASGSFPTAASPRWSGLGALGSNALQQVVGWGGDGSQAGGEGTQSAAKTDGDSGLGNGGGVGVVLGETGFDVVANSSTVAAVVGSDAATAVSQAPPSNLVEGGVVLSGAIITTLEGGAAAATAAAATATAAAATAVAVEVGIPGSGGEEGAEGPTR